MICALPACDSALVDSVKANAVLLNQDELYCWWRWRKPTPDVPVGLE